MNKSLPDMINAYSLIRIVWMKLINLLIIDLVLYQILLHHSLIQAFLLKILFFLGECQKESFFAHKL